jgi:hypothetical protein
VEKVPLTKETIGRKLAIGQVLDIEVQDSSKSRFQSPLLGMRDGRYLITDPPSVAKHGNLRDQLLDKQELIIRTICEKTTGECLGFKSSIEAKLKMPDQLLFIAFPVVAKVHELRSEQRLIVTSTAKIVINDGEHTIQGFLADFSSGGCRFECDKTGELPLRREDKLTIEFVHPESGKPLKYNSKVCSVKAVNNFLSIGMAFEK